MDGSTSLIFLLGFTSKALLGDSFDLFNEDSEVDLIDKLALVSLAKSRSSCSCGVCDCEVGMGVEGVRGYSFTFFLFLFRYAASGLHIVGGGERGGTITDDTSLFQSPLRDERGCSGVKEVAVARVRRER